MKHNNTQAKNFKEIVFDKPTRLLQHAPIYRRVSRPVSVCGKQFDHAIGHFVLAKIQSIRVLTEIHPCKQ